MNDQEITLTQLPSLAGELVDYLRAGDVLTLAGPLAAGKTTLTSELVKEMGYTGHVASPTFVLERRYPLKDSSIKEIIHLDLYRLDQSAINQLDWKEYVNDPDILTIIEWPEKAAQHLPNSTKAITIDIINDQKRLFHFDNFAC